LRFLPAIAHLIVFPYFSAKYLAAQPPTKPEAPNTIMSNSFSSNFFGGF